MLRRGFWFPMVAGAVCLFGLTGCARGPEPVAAVFGKVFYRGAPLHTGTVVFTPDPQRGSSGPAAQAEIQQDGSYRLRTEGREGAVAGWHRVSVLAVEQPLVELPKDHFVIPRSLVPEKYRDPELSGLVREVKPGQENQIDLHLE